MKKLTTRVMAALFAIGLLIAPLGCKTAQITAIVNPDGTTNYLTVKTPDIAKTTQVKAAANTMTRIAFRRVLTTFPQEADTVELYARGAGEVLCQMHVTGRFDPLDLSAGLSDLVLPEIHNPQVKLLVQDARDMLIGLYTSFYNQRFAAELPSHEWPGAVAEVLCKSIDQALIDVGRAGVHNAPKPAPLPATADVEKARVALREALEKAE